MLVYPGVPLQPERSLVTRLRATDATSQRLRDVGWPKQECPEPPRCCCCCTGWFTVSLFLLGSRVVTSDPSRSDGIQGSDPRQ